MGGTGTCCGYRVCSLRFHCILDGASPQTTCAVLQARRVALYIRRNGRTLSYLHAVFILWYAWFGVSGRASGTCKKSNSLHLPQGSVLFGHGTPEVMDGISTCLVANKPINLGLCQWLSVGWKAVDCAMDRGSTVQPVHAWKKRCKTMMMMFTLLQSGALNVVTLIQPMPF